MTTKNGYGLLLIISCFVSFCKRKNKYSFITKEVGGKGRLYIVNVQSHNYGIFVSVCKDTK